MIDYALRRRFVSFELNLALRLKAYPAPALT